MTPPAFTALPPCPRQRNTERHAAKAGRAHLAALDPSHALVAIAELPDGRRFKVDGHTRSLLWSRGDLQAPLMLSATVWACSDEDALKSLYLTYDASGAAETTRDQVQGAAREYKLTFETPLLRDGNYGAAIKRAYMLAYSNLNSWKDPAFVYEAVNAFQEELVLLDRVAPTAERFPSGLVGAALLTLKRRGESSLTFWEEYQKGLGTKLDGDMDAVQALTESLQAIKGRSGKGSGIELQTGLLHLGLAAHEAYRQGRNFGRRRPLKPMKAELARAYARSAAKIVGE